MSVEMMSDFNASVYVSEQLNRQLINMSQDLASRCIGECAQHYGFDAEEANRLLGLAMIKVERKAPIKAKSTKSPNKVAMPKASFPLPYNGEFNDSCCYALRQNNGLYTQCTGVRKVEKGSLDVRAQFCKGCATTMQKTGAEVPQYGTIQQRMAVDIFEYVDPKGRKPTAYTKVMKKYKINEKQVIEEVGKLNITIDKRHFVVPEETKRGRPKAEKEPKAKGAKGRPKKEKKFLMVECDGEDLFASLVANAQEEEIEVAPKKKAGKSDEEKEAERLTKEAEKEKKRLAAEEAKKDREEKVAAEKEKKRLAAEQAKKDREEKLAAEKAAKEAAKAQKTSKKAPKGSSDILEPVEEPDVVKKIEFEGKKYLKSKKTGIVYDYNEYTKNGEQLVVGKWNDSTNKIDFSASEEEEEEYDL